MKSLSAFLHSPPERFDEFKHARAKLSGMTNCAKKCPYPQEEYPDHGRAEEAHLDPCESFRVGAFITVLDVLSSGIDKRTKA